MSLLSSLMTKLSPALPNAFGNVVPSLLVPNCVNLIPVAGFKVKGWLKRRCKDCYFVRREERLYVICNTHRRHKQMQMVKDERNSWILTHATQGKVRPW